ncbi:MAG: GntR family transcriptional regulator [Pseudomonadota bacterium]
MTDAAHLEAPARLAPLELGDAPQAIYARLRELILSGDLKAGGQVKIQGIASDLGVSIVPVREAIRMLAAEGLMELRPNRSPIVAPLEIAEILEINTVRLALEPFYLEMAVPAHDDASLKRCAELISEDEAATDYMEKVELNRQFHLALIAPAGQKRALKLIDDQFEAISRFAQMLVMRGMRGHLHNEHAAILDAVAAGKAGVAVDLMHSHISSAAERIALELDRQRAAQR